MAQTGVLPMKRIEELLDTGSFVEIGSYISARNTDFNLSHKDTPKDGVYTGYGTIDSKLVYIYSQDAAVLGGSIGEMHAKKIVSLYDMAMKTGAPIIGLIDCAGLRLEESFDALDAFGQIYAAQTKASGVIPQIQAVFGLSGGGMALSNGLSDFVFMEQDKARVFVNSPNAIDNNSQDKNDYSSAKFQSEATALIDFIGNESEILSGIRELISILPANNEDDMSYIECNDDLNRVTPELEASIKDPAVAAKIISDSFYLLVDGYNVIFASKSLSELADTNIDAARDRLLELLIDYKAYKDYEIILVFDAYRLKNHVTEILNFSGVYVVYTKTAETADQYIEKTTHEMIKKYDVTVATSDGIEQIIIRGKGAILISAREFLYDLEETKENFRKEHIEKQSVSNRLFDSLEGELKQQIEDIRLGNKKEP